MEPLFDSRSQFVGWIDPDANIFNTELEWVVYIDDRHAWSAKTGNWLGHMDGFTCLDREGRPVAGSPKHRIKGMLAVLPPVRAPRPVPPPKPTRVVKPMKTVRIEAPMGGWSDLSWKRWLAQ